MREREKTGRLDRSEEEENERGDVCLSISLASEICFFIFFLFFTLLLLPLYLSRIHCCYLKEAYSLKRPLESPEKKQEDRHIDEKSTDR